MSYVLLFVATGSIAVVIRLLGEHSASRLAGIIAMVPMKILIAWVVLQSVGGMDSVRQSIPGMAIGLIGIAVLLGAAWLASTRFGLGATFAVSLLAWAVAVGAISTIAGPGQAAATETSPSPPR